jgi:PIN domain nuclease of toxin-antitoxin system
MVDATALLWWLSGDKKLGATARAVIAEPENEVSVSAASVWEISVKRASGKPKASFGIASAIQQNYFVELPIEVAHAVTAGELPRHHKGPFDRMLVAQAQLEHLTLVADDTELAKYEVERLDARA